MLTQIIFVTCANKTEAKCITEALIAERLAACINILSPIESHYIWEGKSEWAEEVPLLIKTTPEALEAARARIRALHSYTTPNMTAWTGDSNDDFAAWVRGSVVLG